MISAKGVLEPFDAIAAEAAEMLGAFAALPDFIGAVIGREAFEGVEAVVVLVDRGGFEMAVEKNGGMAVGAAELEDFAGDVASLIDAFDEEPEMFGSVVIP